METRLCLDSPLSYSRKVSKPFSLKAYSSPQRSPKRPESRGLASRHAKPREKWDTQPRQRIYLGLCTAIGVLFGCFGRKIDGPGLSGGLIYQGHLFPLKGHLYLQHPPTHPPSRGKILFGKFAPCATYLTQVTVAWQPLGCSAQFTSQVLGYSTNSLPEFLDCGLSRKTILVLFLGHRLGGLRLKAYFQRSSWTNSTFSEDHFLVADQKFGLVLGHPLGGLRPKAYFRRFLEGFGVVFGKLE